MKVRRECRWRRNHLVYVTHDSRCALVIEDRAPFASGTKPIEHGCVDYDLAPFFFEQRTRIEACLVYLRLTKGVCYTEITIGLPWIIESHGDQIDWPIVKPPIGCQDRGQLPALYNVEAVALNLDGQESYRAT